MVGARKVDGPLHCMIRGQKSSAEEVQDEVSNEITLRFQNLITQDMDHIPSFCMCFTFVSLSASVLISQVPIYNKHT